MPQCKKKQKPGSGPKVALQEINKVLKSILNYICGRSCEGRMRLISRCCHWALGSHFHKYRKEKQSGSSIQQQLICNAAGLSGWGGHRGSYITVVSADTTTNPRASKNAATTKNHCPSVPVWHQTQREVKQQPSYTVDSKGYRDIEASGQKSTQRRVTLLKVENYLNIWSNRLIKQIWVQNVSSKNQRQALLYSSVLSVV